MNEQKVFGEMAELLTKGVQVSAEFNRKDELFTGAQRMWDLRQFSVAWARAHQAQQVESLRLRKLGSDIETARKALANTKQHLRLDVPQVKAWWEEAVAKFTALDDAYKADSTTNDAARVDLRIQARTTKHGVIHQSLTVIETYKRDVQEFVHSDEECIRRAHVKHELQWNLHWKNQRFQEGVEIDAFCNNQTRLFREIGEKLDRLMPYLMAESEAAVKKNAQALQVAAELEAAKLAEEAVRVQHEAELAAIRQAREDKERAQQIETWQACYEAAINEKELMGAANELAALGVRVDPLDIEERVRDLQPKKMKQIKQQPAVTVNLVTDLDEDGIDWSRIDPRTSQRAQRRLAKQARR